MIFKKVTSVWRQIKSKSDGPRNLWNLAQLLGYMKTEKFKILDLFDLYSSSNEVMKFCDLEVVQILRIVVNFLSLGIFPWTAYRVAWVVNLQVVRGIWLVLPYQGRLQPTHLICLAVHQNHLADKIRTKQGLGCTALSSWRIWTVWMNKYRYLRYSG